MQTQWVTTNIRFPKDLYDDLKEEAFKEKKSLSALVREKVKSKREGIRSKKDVAKIMAKFRRLARENARQNPGISFSQKLIEMRYEQ